MEVIRVFVIEDNQADFILIKEITGSTYLNKIILEGAADLKTGIARLKEKEFDLVLLDLGLPDSTGLNSLEVLHSNFPQLPTIVLTGLEDELAGVLSIRMGAQDYLIKGSIDSQLLMRSIRHSIERKKVEESLRTSTERYKILFEKMTQGVIYQDSKGRVISANPAALNILGRTIEQLKNDQLDNPKWKRISEDGTDLPAENHPVNIALKEGRTVENVVLGVFNHQDIGFRWLNITAVPIFTDGETKPAQVFVTLEDITERKKSEVEIRASLKEKEILLKEIHHRVKNNLQIITSLLNLQSDYVEDEKARNLFDDSKNRIRTMAMIHEMLYQSSNLSEIGFSEYTRNLISYFFKTYNSDNRSISIEHNVEGVSLSLEMAIPCGLIINELISNALKHAFTDQSSGEISVSFSHHENCYNLVVADNGRGLPEEVDYKNSNSLGLILIDSLVKQLKGRVELDNSSGAKFTISFPS